MNSVHDLGGMMGFGPVVPEQDEPVFHADWERRVFASTMLGLGGVMGTVDTFRHAIERMGATQYLATTYYEHWLAALEILVEEKELDKQPVNDAPLVAEVIDGIVKTGAPSHRETSQKPRYAVGDRVRAKNLNPTGHTRLPRYARGKTGVIEMLHGNHVFPDSVVHGLGEDPQPLYAVKFTARALWGDDAPNNDSLCVDLWENYLENA